METDQIDFEKVLENLAGDSDLLTYAVSVSVQILPQHLEHLREALQGTDAKVIERAAHTLKGSVATYLVEHLVQSAFAIEKYGHEGAIEKARALWPLTEVQFKVFFRQLQDFEQKNQVIAGSPPASLECH